MLSQAAAQDEIQVGGTLTEDAVWTKDHIYIVVSDLRIIQNVTLTIEPGVQIKVNQGRGIFVIKGNLLADGTLEDGSVDSIHFNANYTERDQRWKWKGLIFISISEAQNNILSYVSIKDAEVGLDIYVSDHFAVKNTSILNSQQLGIRISNSHSITIEQCRLLHNYDGIEMNVSNGDTTSGNLIHRCVLKNENHNIYMFKNSTGCLKENLISNNLIEGGNNGIWIDNGGGISKGSNTIRQNIIIDNGNGAGYGLLLSLDSLEVTSNIFWKNNIAIQLESNTEGCRITNNNLYENNRSIILTPGSSYNVITDNTFTKSLFTDFEMGEQEGTNFRHNNLVTDTGQKNIIHNLTPNDVSIDSNFWHTQNDTVIQNLIWDYHDSPAFGRMNFIPFLADADTTNPISPPLHVKKQIAGDLILVSWSANPENDLHEYKVYFGHFEDYHFDEIADAGTNTSMFIPGLSVNDTIAVTAVDRDGALPDAQVEGHESPFAFAEAYPYAGPDKIICQSVTEYHITQSSVPFPYLGLSWHTSGDGSFNNENQLHPIYYPGPQDVFNGTVIITLTVTKAGEDITDKFTLSIIGDPYVFAGNDTIVYYDDNVTLSTALAANYSYVIWTSSGDGYFENDTVLNTVYFPGGQDIAKGQAELILNAFSDCGSSSDTVTVYLEPYFSVEGRLWNNGFKVDQGIVLALRKGNDNIKARQLCQVDEQGNFRFEKLAAGDYYMYGVPDTMNIGGAVPAYYARNISWQDAYLLPVDADVYDIDITLPSADYLLPQGEASISGRFLQPPSGYFFNPSVFCDSWFTENSPFEFCSGGVSNITILLYNTDKTKLLDYTLTDSSGNFFFHHLPYGNYRVSAEKAGYITHESSVIGLSPEHQHETDVELRVEGLKIGIYRNSDTPPITEGIHKIFPNPVHDQLYLFMSGSASVSPGDILIYNIQGQLILKQKTGLAEDSKGNIINVSGLPPGIYFGTWSGWNFKFVKY